MYPDRLYSFNNGASLTMICKFELRLGDRVWETLGLTPEEREVIRAHPIRPTGFLVERWTGSFLRFRVFETKNGERREWTRDVFPQMTESGFLDQADVGLWWVSLPEEAEISLYWTDADSGNGKIVLAATGGRFGWIFDPIRSLPKPEHTLFEFDLPLHGGVLSHDAEFGPLNRLLKRDDSRAESAAELGGYCRTPCLDIFECDESQRGFMWTLFRYDMRRLLDAEVKDIERIGRGDAVTGIMLEIDCGNSVDRDEPVLVRADPLSIEPTNSGRTLPKSGEVVRVVLDDECEVARMWLHEIA